MMHLAHLPPVVMAAMSPVTYAEFYCVVTNDPHDGYPSAIYEDETPVPVGVVLATPANIVSAVYGDSNPAAYLLFSRGEMDSLLHASSCRSLCVLAVKDAL